ncbi:hypothetical protein PENTCL1PPCAC_15429, partial [Pristionchus entomophagus]
FSDDDECDMGTDNCDRDTQDCINLPGHFNCTCKAGFEHGSDGKCKDIDECALAIDNCHALAICKNEQPLFSCHCKEPYIGDDWVTIIIVDVDECKLSPPPCNPNANCKNTEGSFECACKDGYKG